MIAPLKAEPLNPELQVGVVQRFGEDDDVTLRLESFAGAPLTVSFQTGEEPQQITTPQVLLEVQPRPLPQRELQERVVLSTHRSFESAEDSAQAWQQRGIATEIAQPDTWQVWAQRETYHTPLLRRLLLQNLQSQGFTEVFLDSQVLGQEPQAVFIANGYRYHRSRLEVTAANQRIRVVRLLGGDPQRTRLYGGKLRLQPNAYGTYTLVNQVPIETYLRGVVPHEIGLGAPAATIAAQAILARTYALRNLRRFTIDDYQLCADTHCQVYWGLGGAAPVTDKAIAATKGMVLTYQGELVDALYSSTSGGVTAPFSHVWNGPDRPYLKAVVDSVQGVWDLEQTPLNTEAAVRRFLDLETGFNEARWDTFRWQRQSDLAEITQDVRAYVRSQQHPLADFTEITSLQVSQRAASGRVQTLVMQTDLGEITLVKDEIIRVLSAPRSLLFYLDPIYEETTAAAEAPSQAAEASPSSPLQGYRFVGGGFGHGVGMSQTGAYRLGALGWSSEQILQFYYPGTTLEPIHDDLVFWRPSTDADQGDQVESDPDAAAKSMASPSP
ncbi:SpoIID/LytB domain-containing protein [Halomicronema hongdechloris]|nr:SpoIID/LytB domain-containing protein [Halomicronema hongdechloris]